MKLNLRKLTCILISFYFINASVQAKIAKIIKMRGIVKYEDPQTKEVLNLKKGDWIKKGYRLITADNSFARLLFLNKSKINVGPKSEMVINDFQEGKPGVFSIFKGQVRSVISKDPLAKKNNQKKKTNYYFKTQTAAIGIRGTDFVIIHKDRVETTSLVTFSGEVAMGKIDISLMNRAPNLIEMERALTSDNTVVIKSGQYSGVNPRLLKASIPIKISPAQLASLEGNKDFKTIARVKDAVTSKRKFRSPIPPGVSSNKFTAKGEELNKALIKTVGKVRVIPPILVPKKIILDAPRAGGFIDFKTGVYVPPPKGSTFDDTTGVFIPPASFGGFNSTTGEYLPPEGFQLTEEGQFIIDESVQLRPDEAKAPILETPLIDNKEIDEVLELPEGFDSDLLDEFTDDTLDEIELQSGIDDIIQGNSGSSLTKDVQFIINL